MNRTEGKPLLSICIPTYNRAPFLDEAVESIVSQITDDIKDLVEICISDNASEDNTEDIINKWKSISPIPIIYHRNERNMGADYNYLKVVEIANGDYCWYLGSDDKIVEGSTRLVIDYILEFGNACIFISRRRIETDKNMKRILGVRDLFEEDFNLIKINSNNRQDLLSFFKGARCIGSFFSYLSVIIFKKNLLEIDDSTHEFLGTAYVHAYQLFKIMLKGCDLVIIDKPIVYCRLGNDSFMLEGFVKRVYIDYDGYIKIADKLFSKDREIYNIILRILRKEHGIGHLLIIERHKKNYQEIYPILKNYLLKVGWSKWELYLIKKITPFIVPIAILRKQVHRLAKLVVLAMRQGKS